MAGIVENSGYDYGAVTTGTAAEIEINLETDVLNGVNIENFAATSEGWEFSIDDKNFTLSTDGVIQMQGDDGVYIDVGDDITPGEATAFNNLLLASDGGTPSISTNGRTQVSTFRPTSLFQKMLYSISNQMNEMFLDILAMSTVLANGSGLRGILLLAEKGITIDGTAVSNIVLDNGQPIGPLTTLGEMIEKGMVVAAITDADGAAVEGDVDSILVYQPGSDVPIALDLSDVEGLEFVVSPPADSADCIDVKLTDHESILESPGTLFLIQQLLQQMKDSMQAIGAVGKVGGDVRTTAVQSFVRDMNG